MLTLAITPDKTVSRPTRLVCSLNNTSTEKISFLYWNTIFDPLCPKGLLIRASGLPRVRYRGASAKYLFDPETSLVSIGPGESIEHVLEVSENYLLPAEAHYEVIADTVFYGIVGELPEQLTSQELQVLDVNVRQATVMLSPVDIHERFPLAFRTSSQVQSPGCDVPLCWNSYYEPPLVCVVGRARYAQGRVEGGTAKQKALVRTAVDKLFHRLAPYGPFRFELKNDALYRRWFGTYTAARAAKVNEAVRGIAGEAVCKSYVIYILSQSPKPDTIAFFRKPSSDERYGHLGICPLYFRLAQTGNDSQAGTIAHELSHGYADTDDHKYGQAACLALAKSQPDLAVKNADSVQYYLEDVLLSLKQEETVVTAFEGSD